MSGQIQVDHLVLGAGDLEPNMLFLPGRVKSISLGQGQGPIAERLIREALESGEWIFLQNCHLAVSWMLAMEELIKTFTEPGGSSHTNANRRQAVHVHTCMYTHIVRTPGHSLFAVYAV